MTAFSRGERDTVPAMCRDSYVLLPLDHEGFQARPTMLTSIGFDAYRLSMSSLTAPF